MRKCAGVERIAPLSLAMLLVGCAEQTTPTPARGEFASSQVMPFVIAARESDQFFANFLPYCGKAYAGKIVANTPASRTPDPFEGKALVMHVRGCEDRHRQISIPFHVGDDRSRTWVITRTPTGLRLKHDHRHADGSPDATTMYGGEITSSGSTKRQEFPVDAESTALFKREGLTASLSNTWAMELIPSKKFVYELSRPDGRLFRIEFDLTKTVPSPPPPWGAEK